jgi:N-acetylmuramoyl-L-alanine amidase
MPKNMPNRPNIKLVGGKPEFITIHETANKTVGANAEMHRKFVHNGGGDAQVSFHYVVDDKESIQLMPDDEVAWHAGDGPNGVGNNRSIAIETCVNADGNFLLATVNLAKLVVKLMQEFNIPLTKVVQHNRWSGKNCPMRLRANGWQELLDVIGSQERTFPETGKKVKGAFLRKWDSESNAIEYWGFPVKNEEEVDLPGVGNTLIQYFERARFELHPDGVVRLGRVGAELANA